MALSLDESNQFLIQDLGKESSDRYVYSGEMMSYNIDHEINLLRQKFQSMFFRNTQEYYSTLFTIPALVRYSGLNSDILTSKAEFSEFVNTHQNENFYKLLYLDDCEFLIDTIQNTFISMEYLFISYFVTLGDLEVSERVKNNERNGLYFICSKESMYISSLLQSYFVKAYSILDIVCKLYYEFFNFSVHEHFNTYKKIKSYNILWGHRRSLPISNKKGTLFEDTESIKIIESLRNEFVHNGSWESNPKIYYKMCDSVIKECYMLFPDMIDGRLESLKYRKHFFSKQTKVNDVLPIIHSEFKSKLLETIKLINN